MPNCPNCGVELALGELGGLCPKCLTVYTPAAIMRMPGFDEELVTDGLRLLSLLKLTGKLEKGISELNIVDDALIITLVQELD